MPFGPARVVHKAGGVAIRGLGLEMRIATREGRDLRVGLLEAGRHLLRRAPRHVLRSNAAAGRAAGVDQRRAELREAVELAEVRRTESGRVVASDREVMHRLPAQASLISSLVAERRVVRVAHRAAHTQSAQQREAQLPVRLVHVVALIDGEGERVLRLAGLPQRIRLEDADVLAVLSADRKPCGPVFDMEYRAGDVPRDHLQLLVAGVYLGREDVVEHRRCDLPSLTAEQVERHAAGDLGADRRVAEREADLGDVVATGELLSRLVIRIDEVQVPVEAVHDV